MVDSKAAKKEDKRVKYTKILFLTLFITALGYILTSAYISIFIGLMIVQIILIVIVQVIYYEELPHDYGDPDQSRNRRR